MTNRIEDDALLIGNGQFVEDIATADSQVMVVLRSPVAHGRITKLDIESAKAADGVSLVLTAHELSAAQIGPLRARASVTGSDGQPMKQPVRNVLATDRVVYVGHPIAAVVANTEAHAMDALELIEFDIDDLPVISNVQEAATSPNIWPNIDQNRSFSWQCGDHEKTETQFSQAAHVFELTVEHPRIAISPIETRSCVAAYDHQNERYSLHTQTQGVVAVRAALSEALGIDAKQLRVITADVGGSFAVKIWPYPEHILALVAAKQTGKTIRWVSSRIDSFGADVMGRARVDHARLAIDETGKFLAFSLHSTADMGAFLNTAAPIIVSEGSMRTLGEVYDIGAMTFNVDAMFTNAIPTDAYRGAGKPESNSTLERLIDVAAYRLDIDRLEIRARNLIQPNQIPYTSAVGITYDAGDFPNTGDTVSKAADWHGFANRERDSHARGLVRGIGISYYIHVTGGSPDERSEVRALTDGTVLVRTGTQDAGQGHRTALAMVASQALEISIDRIRVEQGDSDWLDKGGGTGGSNLMAIAGNNVHRTSLQVIEQGRQVSAELFEAAASDIEYTAGVFSVAGTDRSLSLAQVASGFEALTPEARSEPMGAGCAAQVDFDANHATAPNGAYICEVELDPQTGAVRVDRFIGVDDLGRILNPSTVDGQLHGGIGQSIGEVLMEGVRYDETGQILTGSLMDYALPRADDVPMMQLSKAPTGSPQSLLGVKGVGEVASIGAPGAIMNAVHHALRPFGVEHLDIPLTSEKIWQAIRGAKR